MSIASSPSHLVLTPLEGADGEGHSQMLDWVPKTAFRLKPDSSGMPWEAWAIDRALAWLPEDLMLSQATDPAAGTWLEEVNGYAFDGEFAFIPAAHAEPFWSFLQAYFVAAAKGAPSLLFEGRSVALTEDERLFLGDGSTGVWGMRTAKGLWLVFAESDESFGTPFLSQAMRSYPNSTELNLVDASALLRASAPVSAFDPTRAWAAVDCHLANHLLASRANSASYPAFFALIAGAIGDGALPAAHLVVDLDELVGSPNAPWTGERVALVGGGFTGPEETWGQLVSALGATVVSDAAAATRVLVGSSSQSVDHEQGAMVIGEADVIRAVLDALGRRLEEHAQAKRQAPEGGRSPHP